MGNRAMIITDTGVEIVLSVVEKETPSYTNTITEKPVEKGVNIADHIKQNSYTLGISGIVAGDGYQDVLNQLIAIRDNGTLVTYSGLNTVDNLAIESFTPPRGVDISNGFQFDINFKQVRVTSLQTINVTINSNSSVTATLIPKVNSKKKKGKKSTKQTTVTNDIYVQAKYSALQKTGG